MSAPTASSLQSSKVVDDPPTDTGQIFFGAWIAVEDERGERMHYRIVGADEFDPKRNWISIDSPMARALLQRRVDDEVSVETPGGQVRLTILDVSYVDPT